MVSYLKQLGATVSRIGVIGPVAPDYFAENVGDALQRLGHVVTQLGPAHPRGRGRLVDRAAGLARQALPRLDERAQDRIVRAALEADCEIVINVDSLPRTQRGDPAQEQRRPGSVLVPRPPWRT